MANGDATTGGGGAPVHGAKGHTKKAAAKGGDKKAEAKSDAAKTDTAKADATKADAAQPASKEGVGKVVVAAVKSLTIKLSIPLVEGRHAVPTLHKDAMISIKPETRVLVHAKATRGSDKQLRLTTAEAKFTNEITIENPASALSPTEGLGFFGPVVDWIKDTLADVRIGKVYAGTDGQVHVDGEVAKPWPLGDSPVEEEIAPGTIPAIDLDVESLLFGKPSSGAKAQAPKPKASKPAAATSTAPANKPPTLEALLKAAGGMTDQGKLTVELETVPIPAARLGLVTGPIKLALPPKPVTLRLSGKGGVTSDGALTLTISRAATPSLGALDVSGKLRLRSKDGKWSGDGRLRPRLDLGGLKLFFTPVHGVEIPVELLAGSALSADASLTLGDEAKLSLDKAGADLHVRAGLDSSIDPRFSWRHVGRGMVLGSSRVTLDGGELTLDARTNLHLDGRTISFTGGTASVRLQANDVELKHGAFDSRLGAKVDAAVECFDIAWNPASPKPVGHGNVSLDITPSQDQKLFAIPKLHRATSFAFGKSDRASVSLESTGLAELVAKPLELTGHGEAIVDPETPSAGPVGSKELIARVAARTGAELRENNHVELLVDGIRSYQKRMELIRSAKTSICLQTLIFKDDETGTATAAALVEAAKRNVAVRVIVDSLGNVERVVDLVEGKRLYRALRDGGVKLELYNDPLAKALKEIIAVSAAHPELELSGRLDDLRHLKDPTRALSFFNQLFRIASGRTDASPEARERVRGALGLLFGAHHGRRERISLDTIASFSDDGVLSASELVVAARQVADLNHRWHEKYLVIDGRAAVLGGMNIADEYLLGGTGRIIECIGVRRPAWRDTDVFIEGPAAADAYRSFANNWATVTADKEVIPLPAPFQKPAGSAGRDVSVQILQHRPYNDGDHHIANFMIENIKALEAGQKAWIANAYFLTTGALRAYKEALILAAKRGVDVRVLTNSATTSDLPQINQAALYPYRELLEAGVRVWERTGARTMHQKVAVFGTNTIAIGSWNADNRSESLNSEALAVVYDSELAAELEGVLEKDRASDVAKEIKLEEVKGEPLKKELDSLVASIASDLM